MRGSLKELTELYSILSISGLETQLSIYVQKKLNEIGVKYSLFNDQIYSFAENTPLVCAHLDQVSYTPLKELYFYNGYIYGDNNLGADDKNGVWIILQLLKKYKNRISFIFSTGEETVVNSDLKPMLKLKQAEMDKIQYGLVFDRRNGSDIIGVYNNYCTDTFENDVYNLVKGYGYKPAKGMFSDADTISKYVSCVNLSCGYYNAHSENEFTCISELFNALRVGDILLEKLNSAYEAPAIYNYNRIDDSYELFPLWECDECLELFTEDLITEISDYEELLCPNCCVPLYYAGEYDKEELNYLTYEYYEFKCCLMCSWEGRTPLEYCPYCSTKLTKDKETDDTDYYEGYRNVNNDYYDDWM